MQTSLCFWTFPRSLANANIFVSKRGYKSTNPRLALELINTRSPEKRAFIIPIRDHIATILLITTESKWNYLNYHRPTRSGRIGENAINNLRGILLLIPAIINQHVLRNHNKRVRKLMKDEQQRFQPSRSIRAWNFPWRHVMNQKHFPRLLKYEKKIVVNQESS